MIKKPMSMTVNEIGTNDLAAMLGLSPRAISRLADAGVIKRGTRHGFWPMPDSVRGYVESLRAKKVSGTLDAAKLREREAKARLAEMEADEKEGKLIDVDTISATMGSVLTAFTARLANFGDGLASICHNQPGDFVAGRVNDGLRAMLKEISRMPHVPKPK